jgi:hypothetical protein
MCYSNWQQFFFFLRLHLPWRMQHPKYPYMNVKHWLHTWNINIWMLDIFPPYFFFSLCEEFLHTFNMKICTHKTHLEMKLLCSCSLTSKVIQCNAMKFTKNLMRCVHLEDTKTMWENRNSSWWNVKGHYVDVHSMSCLMVEPLLFHSS